MYSMFLQICAHTSFFSYQSRLLQKFPLQLLLMLVPLAHTVIFCSAEYICHTLAHTQGTCDHPQPLLIYNV